MDLSGTSASLTLNLTASSPQLSATKYSADHHSVKRPARKRLQSTGTVTAKVTYTIIRSVKPKHR